MAASSAAISAMHAASASSLHQMLAYTLSSYGSFVTDLQSGTASQRSPQLHESTGDLVSHGGMALVHGSGGTNMAVVPGGPRGSSSSSGCRRSSVGTSSTLGTQKPRLEARASSGAGSTGSAGSSARSGAAHKRHVDDC